MARKRKTKRRDDFLDVDSTVRKLQSSLVDPNVQSWLWRGAKGVQERILSLNFKTLRHMSSQLPLVGGIINARQDQIRPYTKYATEDGDKGFRLELENRTRDSKENTPNDDEIIQLSAFIEQTGFTYDPIREDDFSDYVGMIVRDVYEIDQIATEVQKNRRGETVAFWAVDGATIKRTTDESDFKRDIMYVQTLPDMEHEVVAKYTSEELILDYMYKRSDIRYRGYGYSPIEQCISIITTMLFGYNYIRDQLIKDKMPKGFISVMGDVGKSELDSIRNYWYAAMSGAGAQWNMPILPSGKDGVGIDFKQVSQSNRDMEYHKTMMFISSLVAAVFSIDLAELGIKTDDSTAVIGENSEPRIQSSRDRGLAAMLHFIEQHINKVLRKVTKKYRFRFVGLEQEDDAKKADVRNRQIQGWRSINEIREEDSLEPFDDDWAKMPLSAQSVQMYLAEKSAQQQQEMMAQQQQMQGEDEGEFEGEDEGEFEGEDEGGIEGEDEGTEASPEEWPDEARGGGEEGIQKALRDRKGFSELTDNLERRVRIVIE